jgi:hypothetical protein
MNFFLNSFTLDKIINEYKHCKLKFTYQLDYHFRIPIPLMKGVFSSLKNLLKRDHGEGLPIVTGGKLDITKRLIEKMHSTEKSNMIILYEDYENLKDDFYTEFENEDSNKSDSDNINKDSSFPLRFGKLRGQRRFIFIFGEQQT